MIILDISGSGLFSQSNQFFTILGDSLKFAGGGFLVLLLTVISLFAIVGRSVYKGIEDASLITGIRTLIRLAGYAIGISIALIFMLGATIFFSVSFLKVLLISIAIALTVSFIARETFMFLILKRFGKYIFYFTTLQRISKVIYEIPKDKTPSSEEEGL
jgi:hypothetical protein